MKPKSEKQITHKSKANKIDIRKARRGKQTQYNFLTRDTEQDGR